MSIIGKNVKKKFMSSKKKNRNRTRKDENKIKNSQIRASNLIRRTSMWRNRARERARERNQTSQYMFLEIDADSLTHLH